MKSKPLGKLVWLGVCVLVFLFAFFSFQGVRNPSWGGTTMGTFYTIKISDRLRPAEIQKLKTAVDERLAAVNSEMSTWDPQSELSRFNRFQSLEPFRISAPLAKVMSAALQMSASTDGAFDPTVKPLVDRWGFGPGTDSEPIEEILKTVGWQKISLEDGALVKTHPQVQLDLSAIAKGYGVDAVAEVIRSSGISSFLVEIGGEVTVSGLNPDGNPWRIGIESPDREQRAVWGVAALTNRAMATSGDYRNFRTREDGTVYSHIIDPQTGMPAETDVASVSVLADSCMTADAAATALFVMGSEKGMEWLSTQRDLDAFFILHSTNGTFTTLSTDGFPK